LSPGLEITVRGGSMRPALADGQRVEIRLLEGTLPAVGQVVLVLDGRSTILHRVISVGPDEVVLQGDARPRPDPPLLLSRVLGVAEVPSRPVFARARGAAEALRKLVRGRFSAARLPAAR